MIPIFIEAAVDSQLFILSTHRMTLLEELQARILAKSGSDIELAARADPIPPNDPPGGQESTAPDPAAAPHDPEREASFTPDSSRSSSAHSIG